MWIWSVIVDNLHVRAYNCSLASYLAQIFASYLARGGLRGHP
jgi:hypothetical protein